MTDAPPEPADTPPRSERAVAAFRTLAAALLVTCLSARVFLGEMPFRTSSLRLPSAPTAAADEDGKEDETPFLNRSDYARATFACLLLLACVFAAMADRWAAVGPTGPRWFVPAVVLFSLLSFLSSRDAPEGRSAWLVCFEQIALMAAAWAAMRVFRGRRLTLLITVAAALGAALAVKGIWQEAVERPDRIEHFLAYRDEQLAQQGIAPDSPQARMMETRLRSRGALGYFALANPFGSLLVMLLAAGVAVTAAKLAQAHARRRADKPGMKPGEIHVPTLAAWLTVLACAITATGLLLTRSRGAVGAVLGACVAAGVLWRFRGWVRAHWRRTAAGVGAVLLAGMLAVTGYGLLRDRLPSKTMTFRWYYWTGTAKVIAESPWLGVGPGNFPDAYLRHRRPAADESIKNPHNVILHAMAQYGMPGGACYLVALVGLAVLAFRPGRETSQESPSEQPPEQQSSGEREPPADPPGRKATRKKRRAKAKPLAATPDLPPIARVPLSDRILLVLPLPAVLVARVVFTESGINGVLFVMDALLPAIVLAVVLLAFSWRGQRQLVPLAPGPLRWVVAAGLAAFVVHNLVTFSLWMPGAATAFWLLAGACAGRPSRAKPQAAGMGWRWVESVYLVVLVTLFSTAIGYVWWPVYRAQGHRDAMARAVFEGRCAEACREAKAAALADPRDAQAAADAARLYAWAAATGPVDHARDGMQEAAVWAMAARRRTPSSASLWILEGELVWTSLEPEKQAILAGLPPDLAEQEKILRSQLAQEDSAALRARLGDVLWLTDRRGEARRQWRRANEGATRHRQTSLAGKREALQAPREAAKRDPRNSRLQLRAARLSLAEGKVDWAREQLDAAERVQAALAADSPERFSETDWQELHMLRARLRAIREMARQPATGPARRPAARGRQDGGTTSARSVS